ncbi:hypothetical protein E1287_17610 [Actinomadura sp. KC06]|uniref:hypothetical protein n=1 Tax=Actinomadura sp. KC06 TaxID=2530369 RepID=UPI0010444FC6|nr:hypothetical protein [Actinomadura sp. KC06]TDD34162.1 hypothetical protein E1287_17610 [Actinomadura sp. KC06]
MLLTAVLGGLLFGASAAHASDPVCRPALTNTPDVVCAVPAEFDNRPVESIEWTRDGDPLPQFDDIRQILVSCKPGQTFVIGLTLHLADDLIPSVGDTQVTCPGSTAPPPRISGFFCYADDLYGNPFYCDLFWEGGTDPDEVQVSSNGSQARRTNDYANNHVSISGRCDPYQDTHVSVSVYDAEGRHADATQASFCQRN